MTSRTSSHDGVFASPLMCLFESGYLGPYSLTSHLASISSYLHVVTFIAEVMVEGKVELRSSQSKVRYLLEAVLPQFM